MPSPEDLEEFNRMANAPSPVIPVPELPKIPDEIKKASPKLTKAWEQYEKDQEEWRKGVNFQTGNS